MFQNDGFIVSGDWMKNWPFRCFVASVLVIFLSPVVADTVLDTANLNAANLDAVNRARFYDVIDTSRYDMAPASAAMTHKIDALSYALMGAEYVGGRVGEGQLAKYDKDPLSRFDVFDCTTYVETILAGALSVSSAEFESNLQQIRYQNGHVDFVSRNHFPSVDWFRNNQDKLMDITPEVAKGRAAVAKAVIDKSAWYQHLGSDVIHCDSDLSDSCQILLEQLHSEGDVFRAEPAFLPYVPLTALYDGEDNQPNMALLDRIPSGSVISMVRPNWALKDYIGTNMNVSHQALAIRKEGVYFYDTPVNDTKKSLMKTLLSILRSILLLRR
ncbi:DUF1460 domain-containing protein [Marinomonas pontica]|uniref:N-acetylmuramoyl-L-alanine amidase-like domain-containing protein n=1 Tax=Marinomonas pontica TaxID=264739 RepID=UPI0022436E37|nr:N-acetylmuramoyl-L-alanine amidase-like domain-containing protein [Marinomonas pontica]MCW8355340.1 DUF1460 domain-containing protein [Marinomonas pontica]